MELLDSAVETTASGYALLCYEHGLLRIGVDAPGCRRNHVRDRPPTGFRVGRADRPADLDVFTVAHARTRERPVVRYKSRCGAPRRQGVHVDRQRPPGCAEPDYGPPGVGSSDAARASTLR